MDHFESDGTTICYTLAGAGPPVLLIHGFSGSGQMWEEVQTASLLAQQFRTIVPDCRGHGQSGKPHGSDAYGIRMVEDLVRLLDHLGLGQIDAVGYSMGAEIGLRLTVEYPSRVRSLVIGGSGWSGEPDAANYEGLADSISESGSLGPIFRAMTPPGEPEPTEEQIAEIDKMLEGQDTDALSGVARGMRDIVNLSPNQISAISIPVLGISGEDDPERGNLEKFVGVLPDYTLQVLAGRDHMTAMSDTRFNGEIVDFLTGSRS